MGIISLVGLTQFSKAKDFGTQGQTFEIEEQDMLEEINYKLHTMKLNGVLEKKRQDMVSKLEKYTIRPTPIKIPTAISNRRWEIDPTYTLLNDVRDNNGQRLYKAGTTVNPLEILPLKYTLFFIDGDDEEQIDWALKQIANLKQDYVLILTNGSPIELMGREKLRFYFDQQAFLTKKFDIKSVPAILVQKDLKLHVEEVALTK